MQVNFIVSVQELINPSHDEPSVLNKTVQDVFVLAEGGQSVVAFMPNLPVFEVSHEMGVPATLLTQQAIKKEMARMNIKGGKDFSSDLNLIKSRYVPFSAG